MTDTHTHLYMEDFADGGAEAVSRALEAGVGRMIFPCVDLTSVGPMLSLHRRFPANTGVGLALHPTEVDGDWESKLDEIAEAFGATPLSAIGETGIDLYWDKTWREHQMAAFARHLEMATEMKLPVIIHCREALDETLEVIRAHKERHGELPTLVFHSFTGSVEDVRRIREEADAWFGINGVVTFKNAARLREAVVEIGISRLLLETDSPYLAPVPNRGKRNESSNLPYILRMTASLLSVTETEMEAATDHNATTVFK